MSYLFHGQRSNEEVVLVCKPHPFVLLRPMLWSALVMLLGVLAYAILLTGPVVFWIIVCCALVASAHGFLAWYAWTNSVMLLTTERVVLLRQKGPLNREFSECSLAGIQQVSHEVKGLLHTLFGYGTITVQSAGSMVPFVIPNVPEPYEIQQEIQRAATGEAYPEE